MTTARSRSLKSLHNHAAGPRRAAKSVVVCKWPRLHAAGLHTEEKGVKHELDAELMSQVTDEGQVAVALEPVAV
ncbi:hypothetical protein C0Q70_01360 [Pomacea canaliculata]|uniref:Uncharacterized protein n=1 Tax=Pomacea canaliculata TaxID=400727 RepID=A0A2T7PZA0_POMCA|nr:hypothetical protein C0Q70_01360 [Pomacea canaliculata]